MSFEDALQLARSGKPITRCSWADQFYYPLFVSYWESYELITEPFLLMHHKTPAKMRRLVWTPGSLDLIANDWIEYIEKEKPWDTTSSSQSSAPSPDSE